MAFVFGIVCRVLCCVLCWLLYVLLWLCLVLSTCGFVIVVAVMCDCGVASCSLLCGCVVVGGCGVVCFMCFVVCVSVCVSCCGLANLVSSQSLCTCPLFACFGYWIHPRSVRVVTY